MSVSVIIPVYNAAKFLEQSVNSVVGHAEVAEVLLVEDGSKDDSLKVCEKLAAACEKVTLLRHKDQKNHGAGASRNLGILYARQSFIAFLDADDYYLPNRFEKDIPLLTQQPYIDGVYHVCKTEYDNIDAEKNWNNHSLNSINKQTGMYRDILPDKLFEAFDPIGDEGHFHINTLTVRKSIFEKTGYFNVDLELSQDTDMFIKMAAVANLVSGGTNDIVSVRKVHAHNRIRDTRKLMKLRPSLFDSLFKWAIKKKICKSRTVLIWLKYYEFTFYNKLNKNTALKRLKFCFQSILSYPPLLVSYTFWKKIPYLSFILNKIPNLS